MNSKIENINSKSINVSDPMCLNLCYMIKKLISVNGPELNGTILQKLARYKKALIQLSLPAEKISIKNRRRIIKQQGKGFLPLLIPIIAATLVNAISKI